jgi:hypothetical protein
LGCAITKSRAHQMVFSLGVGPSMLGYHNPSGLHGANNPFRFS